MDDPSVNRDKWGSQFDFILSCLGYAVGLGNVWRFPFRCAEGGGASFMIPYLIMMIFAGFPVFYMELAIGQYCGLSPHLLYRRMSPIFGGIGYTMVVMSIFTGIYYNMILGWALYYLAQSMQTNVPWNYCNNTWNSITCTAGSSQNSTGNATTASKEFFNYAIGGLANVDGFGTPKWHLILSLFAAWVLVFFCLLKGVKSSGKVVYFTATFPYVLLLILLIRGLTLDGAGKGLEFYLSPNLTKLTEGNVWSGAANQIFFSLSLGGGGLSTLASYNKFRNNLLRDTLIVVLGNCATSFFAGFAVFSVVGHVAHISSLPVETVAKYEGAGLAFIVYPVALSKLVPVQLWSILFFFMIILLGIDSQMVIVEVPMTTIFDQWPKLRKWPTKVFVLLGMCATQFTFGILLTTERGPHFLGFVDHYAVGSPLVITCLIEVCMVSYVYGLKRFVGDIKLMLGLPPKKIWRYLGYPVNIYWTANWIFITPALLFFVLIFGWAKYQAYACGKDENDNDIPCPAWFIMLGWVITMGLIFIIPLNAIVVAVKAVLWEKGLRSVILPSKKWGPNDADAKKKIAAEKVHEQRLRFCPLGITHVNEAYDRSPTIICPMDAGLILGVDGSYRKLPKSSWEEIKLETPSQTAKY